MGAVAEALKPQLKSSCHGQGEPWLGLPSRMGAALSCSDSELALSPEGRHPACLTVTKSDSLITNLVLFFYYWDWLLLGFQVTF